MKKENADKWVAALRSGKYKQTKGHLQTADGFCCLGVLLDINGIQPVKGETVADHDVYYYGEERAVIANQFLTTCDIKEPSGMFSSETERNTQLSALNDDGKSFAEIADIIEKNWEVI